MALFTGTYIIDLDATDSTNNYALNLLREKQPFEGTVVRTFRQTAGRGQRHKQWESEDLNNLTFSIIYYPVFLSVSRQFQLSKAVALGVCDFVNGVLKNKNVTIKWPNDIYIGNKKVGGILIENAVSLNKLALSVIGIGLNINQTVFSNDIPNPVSLKLATGNELSLDECFEQLCVAVEARYMLLKAGKEQLINDDYHAALFGLNEEREFMIEDKLLSAKIVGVGDTGRLKLKNGPGLAEYDLHQVVYKF